MKQHYEVERDGQLDFFDNYGINYKDPKHRVLIENTDGVHNGNLLEFKLNISNLGSVLFQAIKYLSHLRVIGDPVPARILLIDLNKHTAYVFKSSSYLADIEKTYVGGASKNNAKFADHVNPVRTLAYSNELDSDELGKLLINKPKTRQNWYIPVHIDENDIVGWANKYYEKRPKATKGDFLGDDQGQVQITGEIRKPVVFKDLIIPYQGKTNEKFKYLMDCLNDRLSKKDLGAFYTPELYAEKASELVLDAVSRVPKGNDYIILDRCAGTGNLEQALVGKYDQNGSELISHAVVSTAEYYEYKCLFERLSTKVKDIIPPTEANVVYENGKIANADAMSKDYINNPILKRYINNPKMTIILFENPPYRDVTSTNTNKTHKWTDYVSLEMKANNLKGALLNDLSNRFIWSGFHYYLRQPTDSFVLFSPAKYFKLYNFVHANFVKGYLFNRKYFHASGSAITCAEWQNMPTIQSEFKFDVLDIDKNNKLANLGNITINKIHSLFTDKFYDKRKFSSDTEDGICCNLDGTERLTDKTLRVKKLYNLNIIGYLRASSYNFNALGHKLLRCGEYDACGFFLRKDNYSEKLPLWVAKMLPLNKWYEKEVYATTADGGHAYERDKDFLKECLIYTVLSNQNKCLTFKGSDGRFYRNELCLDTTNGSTVASADLAKMKLNDDEQKLVNLFSSILAEAKKTSNYNNNLTYGVYQITKELNTWHKEDGVSRPKKVYDYPILNGYLTSLKKLLKQYYLDYIKDKMFKYELIK